MNGCTEERSGWVDFLMLLGSAAVAAGVALLSSWGIRYLIDSGNGQTGYELLQPGTDEYREYIETHGLWVYVPPENIVGTA